ncbi:MAG: aldehyde dehydrogenase family protein [Thermoleophilia bacterium]
MAVAAGIDKYQAFIGGEKVDGSEGETFEVVNPATGQVMAAVAKCTPHDVDKAVAAAVAAGLDWASRPVSERSKALLRLSALLVAHTEELAVLETAQHGSPIRKTMNFDLPQCADTFEYFAGIGRAMTGDTLPVGPWAHSVTVKEPLGVIGLITPWNFPALMVAWKLAAALITGNTCIVKPPSAAPLTVLRLAELCVEAGIPGGAVNVLTGPGESVGEAMVTHPGIAKIGFTGDTSTGKRIMKLASDTAKPVGLELGGNNALIVLEDADVDAAVEGALFGSYFNTGQVCAASSRLFIHESLYDEFVTKFVEGSKLLRVGDPMDPMTVIGPVPFESHREKIERYVASAKASGATVLLDGGRPDTPETQNGYFVLPTIFGDADNSQEYMQEEIFGPVVGVGKFTTNEEAMALANSTKYGLSASIWTKDVRVGLALANQLQVGTVWLNEHLMLFCDTPWGGCKESGYGKDLSTMVLEEYVHTKHIYVDLTGAAVKPWYAILK